MSDGHYLVQGTTTDCLNVALSRSEDTLCPECPLRCTVGVEY